jgi:putative addiction module component (TIGR02574 family)
MSESARSILEAALNLSDDDRMIVAGGLLETLPAPPDWIQSSDQEFHEELIRRAVELESGTEKGVPWSEVKEILQKDIDARSNR